MAFNDVCDDDSPDDNDNVEPDVELDIEPEDNGPSDAEIEDTEIERLIAAQEQSAMEALDR